MRALVSCAPAWSRLARRELETVLPAGSHLEELGQGTWLLAAPGGFAERSAEMAGTVFVRHCFPVVREVPLPSDRPEIGWEALAAAAGECLRGGATPVQVQVRVLPGGPAWGPGEVAARLRTALRAAGHPAAGGPAPRILSVALGAGAAYLGVSTAAQNLSPWPGGEARLRRDPEEIARSARKLEEALLLFGIQPPAGGRAVDLGASPGGYTALLLRRGLQVVAVDTGALSPRLAGAQGLTFLRGPAHRIPLPQGPFDLLTADLSWDPLRAADCALRFRPLLRPGAEGLVTIKFFGGDPLDLIARVRHRLEEGYRVLAVRHLFHDRDEATAHLRA